MDKPGVSVVMVVCNAERFLAEAIESILDQTFRGFEFIIVDFGSTDGSPSIVSRYQARDSRIRLHVRRHCSYLEARNASCLLAQGPYIAVMDADDVALKGRLMGQIDFMEKNPEVGVLGGSVELIDAAGNTLTTRQLPLRDPEIKDALPFYCPLYHPAVVLRKEILVSVGGYRSAVVAAEDYDLWLRMAERCELANLEAVVLKYRVHPDQVGFRNLEQQAISTLAAQAAASLRRSGRPDPLSSVKEITPAVLAGLGVTKEVVENTILMKYRDKITLPEVLNLDFPTLPLVDRMLASLAEAKHVHDSVAAAVWIAAARAFLRQRKIRDALAAATRAFLVDPASVADIGRKGLGRLLQRAGLRTSQTG